MLRVTTVCACWLLYAGSASAMGGYQATYELQIGSLSVGTMERSFNIQSDGTYRLESKFRTTGLAALLRKERVLETSSGIFVSGAYLPNTYTYVRTSKKKPRDITIHFDRDNSSIKTMISGNVISSPLREGELDKLVYQAALMHDLTIGKTSFRYPIADRGKQKIYQPVTAGHVVIKTDLGQFDAIKIIRQRTNETKRTISWCAPALDYLPVKVAHRGKDGTETIASLIKYQKSEDGKYPSARTQQN